MYAYVDNIPMSETIWNASTLMGRLHLPASFFVVAPSVCLPVPLRVCRPHDVSHSILPEFF